MNSKNRKGFTLIELIAALGITVLMGYFFVSIGGDFVTTWDHVGDSVARETEARSALDTIARDLESTFLREGSDVMFAVDVLSDNTNAGAKWEPGSAERPSSSGYDPVNHEYGWAGSWLRFVSASPSLNAVGYQIIRSTIKDGLGTPRYMLYRNVVAHDSLVANAETSIGFDLSNLAYTTNGDVTTPIRSNILAVNVIDFGVRLYIFDSSGGGDPSGDDAPDGLRLIFPADSSSALETTLPVGGLAHAADTFTGTTYGQRYPDVVEVFVRVLSEGGAAQLSEMEESGENSEWQEVVDNHSRLYRRYVRLRGEGGV